MGNQEKTITLLLHELEQARRKIAELENDSRKLLPDGRSVQDCYDYFRIHFSLANDVMYSYDDKEGLKYISPNVERILGYKPEELLGRKFEKLLDLLDPDDRGEAIEDAAHVLEGRSVMYAIYRFITKDGERKFGEVSGVPLIRDGKVAAVVSVAREIRESAARESRHAKSRTRKGRMIPAQGVNPWLLLDRGGVVLDLNEAAADLLKKDRADVVGSSIFSLPPEKIAQQRKINFDRIMASGKSDSFVEEHGGRMYYNVMAPQCDEHGAVSKIEVSIQELTGKR